MTGAYLVNFYTFDLTIIPVLRRQYTISVHVVNTCFLSNFPLSMFLLKKTTIFKQNFVSLFSYLETDNFQFNNIIWNNIFTLKITININLIYQWILFWNYLYTEELFKKKTWSGTTTKESYYNKWEDHESFWSRGRLKKTLSIQKTMF